MCGDAGLHVFWLGHEKEVALGSFRPEILSMRLEIESAGIVELPLRLPFVFGAAVIRSIRSARVRLRVRLAGKESSGNGEMTLSNGWAYPAAPHAEGEAAMGRLFDALVTRLNGVQLPTDPFDAANELRRIAVESAAALGCDPPLPELAALVCVSPFDMALFHAWGAAHGMDPFDALRLESPPGEAMQAAGLSPADVAAAIAPCPACVLHICHAVGGADPLVPEDVRQPVNDGLPEDLTGWIRRDGLTHFKVKLLGSDPEWDFHRLVSVHRAWQQVHGEGRGDDAPVYSLDLNEQCPSGEALTALLRRLEREEPEVFERITLVEQPSPRGREDEPLHRVHEAARLKPVMLDEGFVSFEALKRAVAAGYTGVCLKACKGMFFSVLAAAYARRHGLSVCVQDLTCTGAAFSASAALAARTGVGAFEANARQYCGMASMRLNNGTIDLPVRV